MTTNTTETLAPGVTTGTWAIDVTHSEIAFTVRHLMAKVRGRFRDFEGTINIAEESAESSATATIQMASIDTSNEERDGHLRSNDFFAIEDFPTMSFVSTGLRARDDASFVLAGSLTIKGVTRPVELAVDYLGVADDAFGVTRIGFEATGSINRKDFGVEANVPLGGDKMLLGDDVQLELTVQATRSS